MKTKTDGIYQEEIRIKITWTEICGDEDEADAEDGDVIVICFQSIKITCSYLSYNLIW